MTNESQRLIPPVPEPADPHWLLMYTHQAYMRQVERDEPDWFDDYEDASALVFEIDTAARLAMTAPSEYLAGLLMGRLLLLRELQALTQRDATTSPASAIS